MSITVSFSGRCGFLNGNQRNQLRKFIKSISAREEIKNVELTYVFLTDEELLKINQRHLNHDYFTDIITFDLSDGDDFIVGELYISKDRIKDHAKVYKTSEHEEFLRVFAHGFLHLLGYNDKTEEETQRMRKEEERCLSLWGEINAVSRETITI